MSTFQLRDLRAVGVKFYHVLYPKEKSTLLKECKSLKWKEITAYRAYDQ